MAKIRNERSGSGQLVIGQAMCALAVRRRCRPYRHVTIVWIDECRAAACRGVMVHGISSSLARGRMTRSSRSMWGTSISNMMLERRGASASSDVVFPPRAMKYSSWWSKKLGLVEAAERFRCRSWRRSRRCGRKMRRVATVGCSMAVVARQVVARASSASMFGAGEGSANHEEWTEEAGAYEDGEEAEETYGGPSLQHETDENLLHMVLAP